jgi:hypothetical protein
VAALLTLSLALILVLGGCAQGALTAAERSRATTLPTPTTEAPDPQRLLEALVHGVTESRSVVVDDDYTVDGHETVVRLVWRARGAVVGASALPIGSPGPGTEVFRSPSELLSRPTGDVSSCWTQAGPSLARFDGSEPPELAALLSAQAIKSHGSLITGSISARSVLGILGTDEQLRRRSLLPPAGVQVPVTFSTAQGGLRLTVGWSDLVAAAGNSSRHTRTGTWTLWFRPGATGSPAAPPASQVVSLPSTDPSFASELRACNARLQ